jgi:hypothetical protein
MGKTEEVKEGQGCKGEQKEMNGKREAQLRDWEHTI